MDFMRASSKPEFEEEETSPSSSSGEEAC